MHPRTHTRPQWQNPLDYAGRCKPVTVEALAATMRDQQAEGGCTEQSLANAGFPPEFVKANEAEATQLADAAFVRQDADRPGESDEAMAARMRVAVGELLPSMQLIVAELQCRGFTKRQMDRHLRHVINMASRDFVSIGATGLVRS